jgi:hypothetical protein
MQMASTVKDFGVTLRCNTSVSTVVFPGNTSRTLLRHQSLSQMDFGVKMLHKCLCVLSVGTQEKFH